MELFSTPRHPAPGCNTYVFRVVFLVFVEFNQFHRPCICLHMQAYARPMELIEFHEHQENHSKNIGIAAWSGVPGSAKKLHMAYIYTRYAI